MLKIKLARFGKKHQPHYRIVINEARDKRDGKYVAAIGYYSPTEQPKVLELDMTAYDEWTKKGAQPTETVAALAEYVRSGKTLETKKRVSKKKKAQQQESTSAEAPKKEVSAETAAEASAPETEKTAEVATTA